MPPHAGHALIAHCGASLSGIGGVKRPGIVHRLDKDTTGLMVVGEDRPAPTRRWPRSSRPRPHRPAQARLQGIVMGRARRRPRAPSTPRSGHPKSRDKIRGAPRGRPSINPWQVLERYPGSDGKENGKPIASLIECGWKPAATHQIRCTWAHIGHPLLGDPVYGPGFRTKAARLPAAAQAALEGLGNRPCMPIYWQSNIRPQADNSSSTRNFPLIWPVYVTT